MPIRRPLFRLPAAELGLDKRMGALQRQTSCWPLRAIGEIEPFFSASAAPKGTVVAISHSCEGSDPDERVALSDELHRVAEQIALATGARKGAIPLNQKDEGPRKGASTHYPGKNILRT